MPVKLGVLTTWGTSCGIATYSEELYPAVAATGEVAPVILAPNEPGSNLRRVASFPVELCWGRQSHGNAEAILAMCQRHGVQVLHVQHEYGLFRDNEAFCHLLRQAEGQGVRVVVTVHTLAPYGDAWTGFVGFLRRVVSGIVVHTWQGRAAVEAAQGTAPVHLVPHGTPVVAVGDKARGQGLLRIPDRLAKADWCLCFGFLGHGKNLECTIKAYALCRAMNLTPNLGLVICGEAMDSGYGDYLRMAIGRTGYDNTILLREKFIAPDAVADAMAVASFGVLNTRSGALSASGQVHRYAAHGVPLAVADCPIYTDAVMAGAIPFQLDPADPTRPTMALVSAMAGLARSAKLRAYVTLNLQAMAEATQWPELAKQYVDIYRGVLTK